MRFEWLSGPGAGAPELIHQESNSGDTIALVFTGQELTEFVTDPGLHGELADWLPWAPSGDPKGIADEPQPSEIAYLDVADYQALVIYGAPPSIDVTPANDEGGHALGEFAYGTVGGAIPDYQATGLPFMLGSDADNLLESLSDEGLQGLGPADTLEILATLALDAGGEADTFLLTDLDIADLIGDYDQTLLPGLAGGDAALLDHYLTEGQPAFDPFVPGGSITIEIDDGSAAANTHILT